jgi:DNA-binding NtrC family response regulator
LRERTEDIPELVDHFLRIYCKKYKLDLKKLSAAAAKRLKKHSWPGNIRELQHTVERAVIMSEGNTLQAHDFFLSKPIQKNALLNSQNLNLEETEKILIRKVIDKHGGNITKAARELGLTRASLYRRIEKYDL